MAFKAVAITALASCAIAGAESAAASPTARTILNIVWPPMAALISGTEAGAGKCPVRRVRIRVRAARLNGPLHHRSIRIFHLHVNPGMRIHELEFHNGAFQPDRLLV